MRLILNRTFKDVCKGLQEQENDDILLKIWQKLEKLNSGKDLYPKSYLHMTESDHREVLANIEKFREQGLQLVLVIEMFKSILESSYNSTVAIMRYISDQNPYFRSPVENHTIIMIRDSGRIMSL